LVIGWGMGENPNIRRWPALDLRGLGRESLEVVGWGGSDLVSRPDGDYVRYDDVVELLERAGVRFFSSEGDDQGRWEFIANEGECKHEGACLVVREGVEKVECRSCGRVWDRR